MLIPLTSSCDSGDVPEWALVELQGRIEPMQEVDLRQTLHIGTMQLSKTNKDVVQLQIGYHILEGKKVPLKKPMAILETISSVSVSTSTAPHTSQDDNSHKGCSSSSQRSNEEHTKHTPGRGGDGSKSSGGGSAGSDGSSSTHCKVIGVLRHKYLFKTRPKALISKPTGR